MLGGASLKLTPKGFFSHWPPVWECPGKRSYPCAQPRHRKASSGTPRPWDVFQWHSPSLLRCELRGSRTELGAMNSKTFADHRDRGLPLSHTTTGPGGCWPSSLCLHFHVFGPSHLQPLIHLGVHCSSLFSSNSYLWLILIVASDSLTLLRFSLTHNSFILSAQSHFSPLSQAIISSFHHAFPSSFLSWDTQTGFFLLLAFCILVANVCNQSLTLVPSPLSHLQGAFPHTAIPFFSSSISMEWWPRSQARANVYYLQPTCVPSVLSLHRSA